VLVALQIYEKERRLSYFERKIKKIPMQVLMESINDRKKNSVGRSTMNSRIE
jgi:hypothetical protein